ncbi:unnamed protein product [Arabis nemorensis]|uniref:Uncharacterized protein n=1 Tax=Arabis nemorensis TaxID=586526 RepID=A0A565CMD6_9BRAS|nr:unnamed protein product [Arabis nemorensis]
MMIKAYCRSSRSIKQQGLVKIIMMVLVAAVFQHKIRLGSFRRSKVLGGFFWYKRASLSGGNLVNHFVIRLDMHFKQDAMTSNDTVQLMG